MLHPIVAYRMDYKIFLYLLRESFGKHQEMMGTVSETFEAHLILIIS